MLTRLTTAFASTVASARRRGNLRRAALAGLGALLLAGCAQPWQQFQPMGETTTAADIDGSGKIVNVRQVLQPNEFYKAQIGTWTKSDVLVNFGRPVETSYYPLMKREVWTYRYLEDNVWYMMYSFYFDDQGLLRTTQKTPDPLHDPDRRSNFF